jgi:hypothetical protein
MVRKNARIVLAYDERNRPGPPWRGRARCPVAHITEARDRLLDLTAGLRPYRAEPVSTRDAVAGETPACSATSASLGRHFVSVPDTPASLPAIFGARPIGPQANSQVAHCLSATRTSAKFRVRYDPATLC